MCIRAQDDIRAARGLLEKIKESESLEEQGTSFLFYATAMIVLLNPHRGWTETLCSAGKEIADVVCFIINTEKRFCCLALSAYGFARIRPEEAIPKQVQEWQQGAANAVEQKTLPMR